MTIDDIELWNVKCSKPEGLRGYPITVDDAAPFGVTEIVATFRFGTSATAIAIDLPMTPEHWNVQRLTLLPILRRQALQDLERFLHREGRR